MSLPKCTKLAEHTRPRTARGFTLVELLIVVAIIGIIAAIAIPNLLSAIQRGKQKRTMGDLKTIATGLEGYHTDSNGYPALTGALFPAPALMTTAYLADGYLNTPIIKDGWWSSATPASNIFQYSAAASNLGYVICSFGRDGAPNGANACAVASIGALTSVDSTTFDCDITFSNGQFVQGPVGKQRTGTGGC